MKDLAYGYCGMPCALCPYYHTKGISRCKGCSHNGAFTYACNIYKCCKKADRPHCAVCEEYPCKKCESLVEFNCLDTDRVWQRTVSEVREVGFEAWYERYARKAEFLTTALDRYNNGRMKRYLCELFINTDADTIESIMEKAALLSGDKKVICRQFKEIASQSVLRPEK